MSYPYTITNTSLTLIVDGQTFTLRDSDANFQPALQAIFAQNWTEAVKLTQPAGMSIEKWLTTEDALGWFTYRENSLFFGDFPVDPSLNARMLRMASEGEDPRPWLKFWQKLQANPSFRSVNQLYAFLEHSGIPIDEEGNILAYKSVTSDYKDFHTGKFDNSVGVVHKMPRNQISDDPRQPCHVGFHVGALGYASSFGSERRLVICKVNPADVVCVPYDSSYQKVRVCEYEVIGNYSGSPLPDTVYHEDFGEDIEDSEEDENDYEDVDADDIETDDEVDSPSESVIDTTNLENYSLAVLRSYAAVDLKIVGASKIPGGKTALISRIRQVLR